MNRSAIETMRMFQRLFILTAAISAVAAVHAELPAPQHIMCPAELPANAIRTGTAPDGWTPYLRGPFRLEFAAPTGGPPELDAELAYYTTTHTKTARINTYDLPKPHPNGIWMKCSYSSLGDISLHKQLDDSIEQCKITISKASPRKVDIACK